jgi:hypothetical protein
MSMWSALLDGFERNKYGIIGTLTAHTVLLGVLVSVRIRTEAAELEPGEMRLEVLPELTEAAFTQLLEPPPPEASEQVTNAVSNALAPSGSVPLSNAAIARIEQQTMDDAKALEAKEFERLAQERAARGEDVTIPELHPEKWDKMNYMDDGAKPVRVDGPATVSHDLEGRSGSIQVPAYLCRGAGTVVVQVSVDRSGVVRDQQVDMAATRADLCMVELAQKVVEEARFNRSPSAPEPQIGSITFLFVAQ